MTEAGVALYRVRRARRRRHSRHSTFALLALWRQAAAPGNVRWHAADHLTTDFNLLIAGGGQDAFALSRRCNLQCAAQPCSLLACDCGAGRVQQTPNAIRDLRRS